MQPGIRFEAAQKSALVASTAMPSVCRTVPGSQGTLMSRDSTFDWFPEVLGTVLMGYAEDGVRELNE